MIEQILKTTDGKIRVAIPGDISELTLRQLMQLQEEPELNDLKAISILSGISLQDLQNVTDINELHFFTDCIFLLSHQLKNLHNEVALPKQVGFIMDGKMRKVSVVSNLSVEPAGAFMAAGEVIGSEIQDFIKQHGQENWQERFNPSLKACCHVLAQYFYCPATGQKYDEYKAEEFTEQVKQLKVTEALPIARYFFTVYPRLSITKTGFWHRMLRRWKKKPASNPSASLNTSIRSTRWQAATSLSGMTS